MKRNNGTWIVFEALLIFPRSETRTELEKTKSEAGIQREADKEAINALNAEIRNNRCTNVNAEIDVARAHTLTCTHICAHTHRQKHARAHLTTYKTIKNAEPPLKLRMGSTRRS